MRTCLDYCTFTFSSFSPALLLVRLTSMVRLFFGAAIHRILSRSPAGCSGLCCSSSSSSLLSWGRRLGPFTASAGATHSYTQRQFTTRSANVNIKQRLGDIFWSKYREMLRTCVCQGQSLLPLLATKLANFLTQQLVNSPSCLSRLATCSRLRSIWSKEHRKLCTRAAKFIMSVVGTLSSLTTCQTAHGHGDVVRHQTATTTVFFVLLA